MTEFQDELVDVLRNNYVSFVYVMYCADIVAILEATVPIFVIKIKKMEADK